MKCCQPVTVHNQLQLVEDIVFAKHCTGLADYLRELDNLIAEQRHRYFESDLDKCSQVPGNQTALLCLAAQLPDTAVSAIRVLAAYMIVGMMEEHIRWLPEAGLVAVVGSSVVLHLEGCQLQLLLQCQV